MPTTAYLKASAAWLVQSCWGLPYTSMRSFQVLRYWRNAFSHSAHFFASNRQRSSCLRTAAMPSMTGRSRQTVKRRPSLAAGSSLLLPVPSSRTRMSCGPIWRPYL